MKYKGAEGNGFRTNGNVNHIVLEECEFSGNGRCGVQLGGAKVDFLSFVRCIIRNNKGAAVVGPGECNALEWTDCLVEGNGNNTLPQSKPFRRPAPTASFDAPAAARVGEPARPGIR